MINRFSYIIILFLNITVNAYAFESAKPLIKQLDTAKGTQRVDILNELADIYQCNSLTKSIEYSSKAFQEGLRLNYSKGWSKGLLCYATCINYSGVSKDMTLPVQDFINYYLKINEKNEDYYYIKTIYGGYLAENAGYLQSINSLVDALEYFKMQNDYKNISNTYRLIGRFYTYTQDFYLSGVNFELACQYNYKAHDTIGVIWNTLYAAVSYNYAREHKKAIEISLKAFELSKIIKYELGFAHYYRLRGHVSSDLSQTEEAALYLDSALKIYKQNEWLQSVGDIYTLKGHARWLAHDLKNSLKYNFLAYQTRKKLGVSRYIASSLINIGNDYLLLKQYDSAFYYGNLGMLLSKKINAAYYIAKAYSLLFESKKHEGNYQEALKYLELKNYYIDIRNKTEKEPSTIKYQLKYELEKKNKDLIELKLNEEKNKNYYIMVIVALIILIAIIQFIRSRQKHKDNIILIDQNTRLEQAYQKLANNEKQLQKFITKLDKLVQERTKHLDSEIQQRKMAEENLIQLKDNIQTAYEKEKDLNVMKTRFISMISHEFRTPMTVITSSADIINFLGEFENSDKIFKQSTKIKNSVKQMTSLIDDVIAFSHADSSVFTLSNEVFDIYDFANEIINEQKLTYKSIMDVALTSNEIPANINSDKRILRHILSNLIGNAIKYTPADKEVKIHMEVKQNLTHILIKDSGIGIPSSDLENIWEPFFRGNNIKNISGTGFGLYIVKDFVKKVGGDIKITSQINKGTKVSLIIPSKQ